MNKEPATYSDNEQEKEIVGILIDSELYLDMDLHERYGLLHFIEASYFKDTHD
jgi:hypothetical protein